MAQFKISVDLSNVVLARGIIDYQVLPLLNQAVRAVSDAVEKNWIESVKNAHLWQQEKAAYIASIKTQETGPFSAVVLSDYKYAEEIELGRPQKDLKRMLNTSLKVRVSRKNNRYLIIPFQHNTPGNDATGQAMPDEIYDIVKRLSPSSVTGQQRRLSGTGAYDIKTRKRLTVNQNTYKWGGRFAIDNSRYAGMVRFDASGGGSRRSSYLTFRVMSEKSSGWIVPAKPGLFLAKAVAEAMQPKAEIAFQEAMRRIR